jgi:hypothetical protein
MRGQQSLFSNIFEVETIRVEEKPRPRNYYMPERNLAICYRYYYYAEIECKRYDKCLEFLENEFYITEARIIDVLSECHDSIKLIVAEKPTIKDLQKKIPHFKW